MSDLLNEQLSALIDGELPAAETTLLLKRLEREPELRERLARYQAAGDVLRVAPASLRPGFTAAVSAALAAEPAYRAAARRAPRLHLKPLAGLAVAASVAAAALILLGRGTSPDAGQLPVTSASLAAAPAGAIVQTAAMPRRVPAQGAAGRFDGNAEPASYVTPAEHHGLGVIPGAELTNYVVAHSEVSGPVGFRSGLVGVVADEGAAGGASQP
jgi:negative regulator of sigma E activity